MLVRAILLLDWADWQQTEKLLGEVGPEVFIAHWRVARASWQTSNFNPSWLCHFRPSL
jgi:hypothetical protein